MNVGPTPRLHLGTEVAAEGSTSVKAALVAAKVDPAQLKGLDAELDAFAKAGVTPQGIGDNEFAALGRLISPETLAALLGRDGYMAKPGETMFVISNRAFIAGTFLDRVRRDTGIKYDSMVAGGSPVPGCTWAHLSNPRS